MQSSIKKIKIIILGAAVLIICLGTALSVKAALPDISDPLTFTAQIGLPGLVNGGDTIKLTKNNTGYIAKMIKGFYNYGLGIGGLLAAIVLMAAGVVWLTSAGSSEKITQAKGLISGSLTGLLLLFGSWILLKTINPNLLTFTPKTITNIEQTVFVGSPCVTTGTGGANGKVDADGLCHPLVFGDVCTTDKDRPGYITAQGFCHPCATYEGDTTSLQFTTYNGSYSTCESDAACPDQNLNASNNPEYTCGPTANGKCKQGSCVASKTGCEGKEDGNPCITTDVKNGYCQNNKCLKCSAYGAKCTSDEQCPSQNLDKTPLYKNNLGYTCGDFGFNAHQDCSGSYGDIHVCDCESEFCIDECKKNILNWGGDGTMCGDKWLY